MKLLNQTMFWQQKKIKNIISKMLIVVWSEPSLAIHKHVIMCHWQNVTLHKTSRQTPNNQRHTEYIDA